MPQNKLTEILFDAPVMVKEGVFNDEELNTITSKHLFHQYAFSVWKKYYLLFHYGNLIRSVENIAKENNLKRSLEIGCGTASTSIYLAKRQFIAYSLGLDINSERIRLAEKRIKWHRADRCEVKKASALDMQNESTFDLIYSMFAFELIKPLEAVLKQTLKNLSKRGHIVLDLANPSYIRNSRKHFSKSDFDFMVQFFLNHGLTVKTEYHSLLTGIDPTGLLKKSAAYNKAVRVHAYRT